MSEKVLSQEEISALLSAVGGDDESPQQEEASRPKERKKQGIELDEREGYLFPMAKAAEISKEVESALALIFDAFAHKGSASFSNNLRTQVAFRLHEVEQIFYGDFIESLPEPSSIWYLMVQPQNLHVAVCLEPDLVASIVAVMLGGAGLSSPRARTQITDLEQAIIENVITIFCQELRQAWSRVLEVEIEIDGKETRPRLLRVYPQNEIMVTMRMSMKIGNSDGTIYWGIPSGLLKSLRDSVSHQRVIESQDQLVAMVNRMKEHTQQFSTVIDAKLSDTSVSLRELINLKPGDVIALDHLVADPALVSINGNCKFRGEIAIANERRTIRMVPGI